jgi:hypothetical protein
MFAIVALMTIARASELPAEPSSAVETIQLPRLSESALERNLAARLNIAWDGVPLRPALERLGYSQQLAIVLDRRIDPGQLVQLSMNDARVDEILRSIADTHDGYVSQVGPVIYIGPRDNVAQLATLVAVRQAQLADLPAELRIRWGKHSFASWPQLSEPRTLVAQWARERAISIDGIERIPHDLWPAQSLPELDLLERLIIALVGFDLNPEIDREGRIRIEAMPSGLQLDERYLLPPGRRTWTDLRSQLPSAKIEWLQGRRELRIVGTAEDHRAARRWLLGESPATRTIDPARPTRPTEPRLENKRFTLTVKQQPLRQVLAAIAHQTGYELVWDQVPSQIQERRISVTVNQATIDELLASILHQQPVTYRRQSSELRIIGSVER